MPKHNQTGRSTTRARFATMPHDVLLSPGYRSCEPPARALLIELAALYNGFNNGRIGLSVRDAAARCNISKDTAARGFQQLEDNGLIEMVDKGSFRERRRTATTFRLLWQACDVTGTIPARRYRNIPTW